MIILHYTTTYTHYYIYTAQYVLSEGVRDAFHHIADVSGGGAVVDLQLQHLQLVQHLYRGCSVCVKSSVWGSVVVSIKIV